SMDEHREHPLLEALEVAVEDVERHEDRVPGIAVGEHLEMDLRVLVAGEADVAHLALLLREVGRLDPAARREDAVRILVVDALVEHPEIDDVGLQTAKAVLEMLHRRLLVAAMVLRHEVDLLAPAAFERVSQPALALA